MCLLYISFCFLFANFLFVNGLKALENTLFGPFRLKLCIYVTSYFGFKLQKHIAIIMQRRTQIYDNSAWITKKIILQWKIMKKRSTAAEQAWRIFFWFFIEDPIRKGNSCEGDALKVSNCSVCFICHSFGSVVVVVHLCRGDLDTLGKWTPLPSRGAPTPTTREDP